MARLFKSVLMNINQISTTNNTFTIQKYIFFNLNHPGGNVIQWLKVCKCWYILMAVITTPAIPIKMGYRHEVFAYLIG